ncbi:unnamed protein product, partial [marine sediment metagenome]
TAKHCVDKDESISVEGLAVRSIAKSNNNDLVVLIIKEYILSKRPIKFAKRNALRGEEVYHLSYPKFNEFMTDGVIKFSILFLQYATFEIIPGCSGGGVFNDKSELVGLAVAFSDNEGITVFEPISDIKKFLGRIKWK